jgi:hypothetical protein
LPSSLVLLSMGVSRLDLLKPAYFAGCCFVDRAEFRGSNLLHVVIQSRRTQ